MPKEPMRRIQRYPRTFLRHAHAPPPAPQPPVRSALKRVCEACSTYARAEGARVRKGARARKRACERKCARASARAHHVQHALDLAAKVRVARRVDDVHLARRKVAKRVIRTSARKGGRWYGDSR
eukprot:5869388-Pleurochrysis_carterae.AAC.1